MATEKENKVGDRFIEDSGVMVQNPENPTPNSSSQGEQTVNHPTVLAVPLFSPTLSSSSVPSLHSLPVTYMQAGSEDASRVAAMSSGPEKHTQAVHTKVDSGHAEKLSYSKGVSDSAKVDPSVIQSLPALCRKSSASVKNNSVQLSHQSVLETLGNKEVPVLCQNKTDSEDKNSLQSCSTGLSTNNEPLNLTLGQKSSEKVIASSLFGVVTKQSTPGKESDVVIPGRTTCVTSSSSDYKIAHPIGSRKVTENIITYHEPMFQSVANTLFENQKNLLMGKRKLEEDKSKGDSSFQDYKKIKLETPNSPNKILDGKVIGKKKCTIENIIERIRTEKTLSRGGNAQTPKPDEFEKEKSVQSLQNEHNSFEKCRDMSGSTGSNQVKFGSAHEQKQEGSVPKEVKESYDIKKEVEETDSTVEEKIKTKNNVTKDKGVPKTCENDSKKSVKSEGNTLKLITSDTNLSKQKKSNLSLVKQKKEGQQLKQMKMGNSSPKKLKSDSGSPKKLGSDSPKQKKEGKVKKVKVSSSSENATANEEKKESSADKKNSLTSCKPGAKSKLDIKMKKFTKMKDLNKEKAKNKKGDKQNDSTTDSEDEGELAIKQTIGEKVKVKRNIQNTLYKSLEDQKKVERKKKSEKEVCSKKTVEKSSVTTKTGVKKQSAIKKKPEIKPKTTKQRKQRLPIACRRVKREASLNAAMFLNILNEKSPRTSKLSAQRSKSDSDIKEIQVLSLQSSHSLNDVDYVESETKSFKKGIKRAKKERESPFKNTCEGAPKLEKHVSQEDFVIPKIEPKSPKKTTSPKRKVSFSDSMLEDIFDAVIQKSIDATGKHKVPEKKKRGSKGLKRTKFSELRKKKENGEQKKTKKNAVKLKEKKEKKFRLQKIKQAIKLTVTKSPEEVAERKRKANLARLERAKELMKTERKVSEKNSVEDKDSDDSLSVASEKEDSKSVSQSETDSKSEENKKVKAKKGALCRAARTHVSVESKTVVENTMSSPRWCECCQSSYYPYQPTQGTQVWRIKHLVDKDSSKSPEPIQSSSNHFIAAHARCEVRPYASPSHVSVIDSTPYVGQIVPHGHIQCSACSCGHSGVFHPGQCQNCTLGGVSNMLPCQRYGSTYSVTYPHTHGSYTHCGCGACYPAGSYHHSVGQTLIHQPQMSMSAESSILLHHPVQLQVTHETTHPVTMPTISHSHTDSSLAHSVQPVPLQLSHSEQNLNNLTHMCQLSQGEVTNMSVMASSSPCDHEIDVGTRDDIVKSVPNIFQLSSATKSTDKDLKHDKIKKTILKEPKVKIKRTELKEPTVKLNRSKSCDSQIKGSVKFKETKKLKDSIDAKVKLKEKKKKSSLLLIKQKQKQLEQKTLKLSQKKESKGSGELSENFSNSKKAKLKSGDNNKVPKKVKNSASVDQKKDDKGEKEQQKRAWHGWSWEGEGVVKKVMNIFDGQTVERKCYNAIRHDDGDMIQVKDCVLVRSGLKEKDIPFVAKVSNFWEDSSNGEMMMSVLWFYRPEHAEGGPIYGSLENEVFAAKHKDETLVACIEDRGYVLTFNEYCRFMAEVERTKSDLPPRKKVVPEPEEAYPSNRIPPVDINPENVFLCRQVYDIKLKRVLKNPS